MRTAPMVKNRAPSCGSSILLYRRLVWCEILRCPSHSGDPATPAGDPSAGHRPAKLCARARARQSKRETVQRERPTRDGRCKSERPTPRRRCW